MTKVIVALALLSIVMLAVSVVPWPASLAAATPTATATLDVAVTSTATSVTLADQGRVIFMAKGCPTCHRHDAVVTGRDDGDFGAPNLTNYQPDPDFVRTWLKDPKAVRPGTAMPNLNLKETEIEAIIAFLSVNEVEP